jgi:hypothetical protein
MCVARRNQPDDYANGNPHPANARLAAHHFGVPRDAIEFHHRYVQILPRLRRLVSRKSIFRLSSGSRRPHW